MILNRMCFLQTLPTLSGASVTKCLCILHIHVVSHRYVLAVICRSVTFRWTMEVLIRCHAVRTSAGGWCHIVMTPHTILSMSYSENDCRWVVSYSDDSAYNS